MSGCHLPIILQLLAVLAFPPLGRILYGVCSNSRQMPLGVVRSHLVVESRGDFLFGRLQSPSCLAGRWVRLFCETFFAVSPRFSGSFLMTQFGTYRGASKRFLRYLDSNLFIMSMFDLVGGGGWETYNWMPHVRNGQTLVLQTNYSGL